MRTVKQAMLFWVFAILFVETSLAQEAQISGLRFGENGKTTRFVLDLSEGVSPRVFLLGNPSRVVIDLPEVKWHVHSNPKALGVVAGYRHGLFSSDTYRIVLDLEKDAIIEKSFSLPARNGYSDRYVIDLVRANAVTFAEAVKTSRTARVNSETSPTPVASTPPVRNQGDKRIVVVDAGHGGVDPGTLGRFGSNEKILTLSISREIKRELEATGRYKVFLTRDKDIYIPHRQRFGLARNVGADLFISVHVDAISNASVRGGTVYTLNETASDKEAARLAAKENKSDILAGVDLAETNSEVSSILIDLAQRETMNSSAEYAEILVPAMRREVRMHKKAHRFANLLVLKSPDVPSILLETGYQTNRSDAAMLNSTDGQRRISRAIRVATDQYFETLMAQGR